MNIVHSPKYVSDKRRGRPERRKTAKKTVTIVRENLAWAAGFFDGEGCFSRHDRVDGTGQPVITIGQVDPKVLFRFRQAVQLGKVYGPFGPYGKNKGRRRPHYRLDIYGFEQVQAVLALLWTWLGSIKREQAKAVLYNRGA